MSGIYSTALEADAVEGGLNDNILLGVDSPADFMPLPGWYLKLIPETAQLKAVLETSRGAVVTGSQYMLVPDRHRPDMVTAAGGALGDHGGYLEEIFIGIRSFQSRLLKAEIVFFTSLFSSFSVDSFRIVSQP